MKKKEDKSRYFTFLLYSENLPDDFKDKLESIGLPIALSPLHDSDKKTKNFEPWELPIIQSGQVIYKKPHYHGIYIANNPVTPSAVRKRLARLFPQQNNPVASQVQIINATVAEAYAYLTHESKDAIKKNKHKYDAKDITLLNNFDLARYQTQSLEEKNEIRSMLIELIRRHQLMNVIDLVDFLDNYCLFEELGLYSYEQLDNILKENNGLFRLYFDGNYQKFSRGRQLRENEILEQKLMRLEQLEKELADKLGVPEPEDDELEKS
jgi:hypothetical protein